MSDSPIELKVEDLSGVVYLIDLATERGAFRGNELLSVGTLREKYVVLVNQISENQNNEKKV